MPKNDKKGASAGDNSVNTEETLEKESGDKKENINADDKENDKKNKPTKAEKEKELEDLKKDVQGKDAKIAELLTKTEKLTKIEKELEAKELAGKTAEEKLKIYEEKNKAYEKKESFRQAFKESQLSADEWDFIDSGDYNLIAKNINTIFTREKEAYANKKLEEFKASKLGEVKKNIPDPKGNSDDKTDYHLKDAEEMKNRV